MSIFPNNTSISSSDKNIQSELGKILLKKVSLATTRLVQRVGQGNYRSIFKNSGLEYAESRPYTFGDDARYIDWTVSSRMMETYTKHFHEDRNKIVWSIFDTSGSMQMGAPRSLYESALETALILMQFSLYQKNKVGGICFSDDILGHVRTSRHYATVEQFLSLVLRNPPQRKKSNLEAAIQFTRNILLDRGMIIIFSDFQMDNILPLIANLSKIHDIILVHLSYNAKDMLPHRGLLRATDTESSYQGIISLAKYKEYIKQQALNTNELEVFCVKNKISYVDISTNDSVFEKLLYFLLYGQRK